MSTEAATLPMPFGRYQLVELIGQGGMAEIYKARASGLQGFEKQLVIKKILPSFANNEAFIQMLIQEAKLASSLHHTNVVQIYDLGEVDGIYFIAMEYVAGRDLLRVLARCTKESYRIPFDLAAHIVAEVSRGLDFAHTAKSLDGEPLGIIHRDISPSNVLISFQGEVKVTDFGVARAGLYHDHKTRSGVLKGKVGYMSPEQVTGRAFDHRADIFSLGILLYETITLKRLFLGRTDLETLMNIRDCRLDHKLKKHDYIPEPIQEILHRALTVDPDDRYAPAGEMHADLMDYLHEIRSPVHSDLLGRVARAVFDLEEMELPTEPCFLAEILPDPSRRRRRGRATKTKRTRPKATVKVISTEVGDGAPEASPALDLEPSSVTAAQVIPTAADIQAVAGDLEAAENLTAADLIAAAEAKHVARTSTSSPTLQPVITDRVHAEPAITERTDLHAPPHADEPSTVVKSPASPAPAAAAPPTAPPEEDDEPSNIVSAVTGESVVIDAHDPGRSTSDEVRIDRHAVSAAAQISAAELSGATFRLRRSSGEIFGPVNFTSLKKLIGRGAVSPAELVRVDDNDWVPVNVVAGLKELFRKNVGIKARPATFDGPLSLLSLPYALYQIAGQRLSGLLSVEKGRDVKELYFRGGRLLQVHSNIKSELFGAWLVEGGHLTAAHLEQALAALEERGGRLGDILVQKKWIPPQQLVALLTRHQEERFRGILGWHGGWYAMHEGEDFELESLIQAIKAAPLTTAGLREQLDAHFLDQVFAEFMIAPIRRRERPYVREEELGLTPRESRTANLLLKARTLQNGIQTIRSTGAARNDVLLVGYILLQAGILQFPVRSPIAASRQRR